MLQIVQNVRFLWNFIRLTRDPSRLDLVFKMADTLDPDRRPEVRRMLARPEVRRYLDGHLPIARLDLVALRAAPEGSFGRAVATFFDTQKLDPAAIHHTESVAHTDFERFRRHMERSHDLWHVVTGFGTDVPGELGLQAFGIAQIGVSLGYLLLAAGFFHQITDDQDGPRIMDEVGRGWQLGKQARPFFGVDWEALFPLPLAEVRAQLGVAPN